MKKLGYFIGLTFLLGLLAGCQPSDHPSPASSKKISVVTSFYPLYEFARHVAGDRAVVSRVIPENVEPHEYEPTPHEIEGVYKSTLFIWSGAGLDPWADRLQPDLEKKGVATLEMMSPFALLPGSDPHLWLDPVLAQKEVTLIQDLLVKVDPQGQEAYQKNAAAYIAQLQQLDVDFKKGLAFCDSRDVVTSHNAFSYLAKRYKLNLLPIAGLSPEEEPSARRLSELTRWIKAKQIKVIFFETMASPKLAETLSRETGAKSLVLNPLEGLTEAEIQSGKDYLSVMRENLDHLKTALSCR